MIFYWDAAEPVHERANEPVHMTRMKWVEGWPGEPEKGLHPIKTGGGALTLFDRLHY